MTLTKNEEQILALERRTGYSSWTGNEGRFFTAISDQRRAGPLPGEAGTVRVS
jgi:hypothetical protein